MTFQFDHKQQFYNSLIPPHVHPFLFPNKLILQELDQRTVECGSWHGEPDPRAFQQHSLCTADIPGTWGSSYAPCHPLCTSAHFLFAFTSSFSPQVGRKQVVRNCVLPATLLTFTLCALSVSSSPSILFTFSLPPFQLLVYNQAA